MYHYDLNYIRYPSTHRTRPDNLLVPTLWAQWRLSGTSLGVCPVILLFYTIPRVFSCDYSPIQSSVLRPPVEFLAVVP
jgi:hypothetical protein